MSARKKLPDAPAAIPEPMAAVGKLGVDYFAIVDQVRELHRLVEGAMAVPDRVVFLFKEVAGPYADSPTPPERGLREALAAFGGLPDAEQRRILNGWSFVRDWPTPTELAADTYRSSSVSRLCTIGLTDDGPHVEHDFQIDDDAFGQPVRIVLTQGVSKRQTLDALDRLRAEIVKSWEHFVGMPMPAYAGTDSNRNAE